MKNQSPFNLVKKEIGRELEKYSREELINWLITTRLLPGNEKFGHRFSLLLYLIIGIKEEKNKELMKVNPEVISSLINLTDKLNWDMVEDWEPKSESCEFGYEGKIFNFLPGDLEIPEQMVERIICRFFEFDKEMKKTFKFSIKKEFLNILRMQNEIIPLIKEVNREDKLIFPTSEIVNQISKIINKYSFSDNLFNEPKSFPEINSIYDANEFLLKYPIINERIFSPSDLIYSFNLKIIEKLKVLPNGNGVKDKLYFQLKRDSLFSLLEQIPLEGILSDLSLNDSKRIFDFGFIFDNKFFLIDVQKDSFEDDRSFIKSIDSLKKDFETLSQQVSEGKVIIDCFGKKEELKKQLDLVFILIKDELNSSSYPIFKNNILILPYNSFKDIFEDLNDKKRTPVFLTKVIDIFNRAQISLIFNFCDFYDSVTSRIYGMSLLRGDIIMLDPHFHSQIYSKNLEIRPKLDIRPRIYPNPYSFKIKRLKDSLLYGYNNYLDHDFFYNLDVKNFFIFRKKENWQDIEIKISHIISGIISYYFEELHKIKPSIDFFNEELILELAPIRLFDKKVLPKGSLESPLLLGEDKNHLMLLFNPQKFAEIYMNNPTKIFTYLEIGVLHKLLGNKKFEELKEEIIKINPLSYFKVAQFGTSSYNGPNELMRPTELDLIEVEINILEAIKTEIKSGMYRGSEAYRILKKVFDFLSKRLLEKINGFDFFKFVTFAYSELESTFRLRDLDFNRYKSSLDTKNKSEYEHIFQETESKIQPYLSSCKLLIEQATLSNIKGKREINIDEWQKLSALAMKMIEVSTIIGFLGKPLSDFVNPSVEIDLEDRASFQLRIEDNPINRHIDSLIKNINSSDLKPDYTKKDDLSSAEDIFQEINKGTLKLLNNCLEKNYGFNMLQYLLTLNMLTNYHEGINPFGVVCCLREKAIDFVLKSKLNLSQETIINVLNFAKLSFKGTLEIVEPWRVATRTDRLMVRPIVEKDGQVILGAGMLTRSVDNLLTNLVGGDWIYSKSSHSDLPEDLSKSIVERKKEVSKEFEKAVFDELKKYSDFCEKNLCRKKNDLCLVNIKEKCPGEIDSLSIHKEKKKLLLWEAKNVSTKFGVNDILWDLQEFTTTKGYIEKLIKKQEFLSRNLSEILDFYKIPFSDEWKVEYCFIFPSNNLIKSFMEKKINITTYSNIKDFIEKNDI